MAAVQETNELQFYSSLNNLREKKIFTDVVLICSDGELEAHRVVLSIRSSYFMHMFLSDFKESVNKQVDFSYIDKNIMQLILDFIYLHSLENISELSYFNLRLLYQTSHLFELKELSDHCWNFIMELLNVDTSLDVWNMVILRDDDSDISRVIQFILLNISEVAEKQEFHGLNFSQMSTFLDKVSKYNFPTEDNLLEAVIRWSVKQEDQKSVQNLLLHINFDFISKEYLDTIIESEKGLFKDEAFEQFFKKQIVPRLKTKTEIEVYFRTSNAKIKFYPKTSPQFFFFGCYIKKNNGNFLYNNAGLRIFDLETEKVKYIDNLPFHLRDGIVPVQCGSHIYVIGGLLNTASRPQDASNLTKSFFRYDWEINRAIELAPLPKAVTKDCHVSVVNKDIFVVQNDDNVRNVILYYGVNALSWVVIENSLPTVIACVKFRDDLYLLCWDLKNLNTIYKLTKSACTLYCSIPIHPKTESYYHSSRIGYQIRYMNTIYSKMVTFFKDEFFILSDNSNFFYTFNPQVNTWKIGQMNFKFGNLKNYRCFTVENTVLMFYNEISHRLYKFDEENADLKEIKTIRGSLEDDPNLKRLDLSKYESMLVFANMDSLK